MICPHCHAVLPNDARVCAYCGAQLDTNDPNYRQGYQQAPNNMGQPIYPPIMPVQNKYCGKAIASFVLSLVGIIVAGLICGILGVIFGGMAISEINRKPYLQGKGLAIAGLVISIIDCVLMFVFMAMIY